jgi:prepilin-type N-terminal cleavage/methylation domain-containing protein
MKNNKFTLITNSSGFTLTELIVVILLIGIFGSIGLTRVNSQISNIRTQVAIDQLTADIDLLKSMAFARHDTLTMVFSTANDSYTIYTGPDGSRSAVTDFFNSVSGVVSFQNASFANVDITAVSFGGQPEIQFLPLGDLKSGGTITINTHTITLQDLTGKWSIN